MSITIIKVTLYNGRPKTSGHVKIHFCTELILFTAALKKTLSNKVHVRVRKAEATGACSYALPFCSQGWFILDQEGQGFDLDSISLKTPQRKRKGTKGEVASKKRKRQTN